MNTHIEDDIVNGVFRIGIDVEYRTMQRLKASDAKSWREILAKRHVSIEDIATVVSMLKEIDKSK